MKGFENFKEEARLIFFLTRSVQKSTLSYSKNSTLEVIMQTSPNNPRYTVSLRTIALTKLLENFMEDLIIRSDADLLFTPNVSFVAASGRCHISGESYLEDAVEFYDGLLNWIVRYIHTYKKPPTITFELRYFNTSSSRGILNMLNTLAKYQKNGVHVHINWYYPVPDEDDMLQEIEDFVLESGVKMEVIPKTHSA